MKSLFDVGGLSFDSTSDNLVAEQMFSSLASDGTVMMQIHVDPGAPEGDQTAVFEAKSPMITTTVLTAEQFRLALPEKMKKSVNQELIDRINATLADPSMYENYRDNLVSYTSIMQDGKFTIDQYINAVKYVSHKLMGSSNIEAYSKTFPEKITDFNARSVEAKDIASYVTAYNKSKLVNLIFEQTMVPSYVLNQDLYQKALNVQAELMITAKSEKVRSDAANSLLTHLKVPEAQKVELSIGMKEDNSIAQLRQATLELARQQRLAIESGSMNAQDVAHLRITTPEEVIDVDAKETNRAPAYTV